MLLPRIKYGPIYVILKTQSTFECKRVSKSFCTYDKNSFRLFQKDRRKIFTYVCHSRMYFNCPYLSEREESYPHRRYVGVTLTQSFDVNIVNGTLKTVVIKCTIGGSRTRGTTSHRVFQRTFPFHGPRGPTSIQHFVLSSPHTSLSPDSCPSLDPPKRFQIHSTNLTRYGYLSSSDFLPPSRSQFMCTYVLGHK